MNDISQPRQPEPASAAAATAVNTRPPQILERAGDLLASYDVLYCDVWGVVHDGHRAHMDADEALQRFRANGGTVILVSNAPVPFERVAEMLDERALSRDAWDAIVSSGDIALAHISDKGYQRLYGIGPRDRDAAFFDRLENGHVPMHAAEAIVCTGLNDDLNETAESYRSRLQAALDRKLPFVCANPDLVVDVGGTHYLCAGAIADIYQDMGGSVFWAGKPHASAYAAAKQKARSIRGKPVDDKRILVIGDAIRTDLKGAHNQGLDALFIASGIHQPQVMQGSHIDALALSELFAANKIPATAAMAHLRW